MIYVTHITCYISHSIKMRIEFLHVVVLALSYIFVIESRIVEPIYCQISHSDILRTYRIYRNWTKIIFFQVLSLLHGDLIFKKPLPAFFIIICY